MKKGIYDFKEPSWLTNIPKFEHASSLAAMTSIDSSVLKSISRISSLDVFGQSSALKSAMDMSLNINKRHVSAFEELASRSASIALSHSKAIQSMVDSKLLTSIAAQNLAAISLREKYFSSTRFAEIEFQESVAIKALSKFSELSSFKAFNSLENSPFRHVAEDFSRFNDFEIEIPDIDDQNLIDAESELSNELSTCKDFNLLSDKAKQILNYIYHSYFLPILLGCGASVIMFNVQMARDEFKQVATASEVRSLARSYPHSFDSSFLGDYRVTIGDNLHLRKDAGMKSPIISEIPIGSLLEIIDNSNRSWLLVDIEINGKIETGWVSRKFAIKIR